MSKSTSTRSPDRLALERAAEHAFAWLEGLDTRHVGATATVAQMRARLARPLADAGVDAAQVIDDLVTDTAGGVIGSQGGRFFGWVIGGGVPAAMAADWLTTVWDQNSGVHACGPALSVVEEVAAGWLREIFDLPSDTGVGFVTGAQMAHVTCLAAARHALLRDRGWDVERRGLNGAPPIRVLVNADRHATVDRAVRFLGIGLDAITPVAVDEESRVVPEALADVLAQADAPTIVVLQAGELNLGGFDRFEEIAPIARAAKAWVHVDGAFGLWAKASPGHRHRAQGMELCDSWTTDGHKYLNVPYDSGMAFVRDARAHRASLTVSTSYLRLDAGILAPGPRLRGLRRPARTGPGGFGGAGRSHMPSRCGDRRRHRRARGRRAGCRLRPEPGAGAVPVAAARRRRGRPRPAYRRGDRGDQCDGRSILRRRHLAGSPVHARQRLQLAHERR